MSRPLTDHKLPGLGPRRLASLMGAGVLTLEALAAAKSEDIGALQSISERGAAALVASARAALADLQEDEGAAPLRREVRKKVGRRLGHEVRPRTGSLGVGRGRLGKRSPPGVERVLSLVLDRDLAKKHMKRTRANAKRARKAQYGMD
jgi:hypothetical protein